MKKSRIIRKLRKLGFWPRTGCRQVVKTQWFLGVLYYLVQQEVDEHGTVSFFWTETFVEDASLPCEMSSRLYTSYDMALIWFGEGFAISEDLPTILQAPILETGREIVL